jgi:hypothetical protein
MYSAFYGAEQGGGCTKLVCADGAIMDNSFTTAGLELSWCQVIFRQYQIIILFWVVMPCILVDRKEYFGEM